jgi:hypothetical protein
MTTNTTIVLPKTVNELQDAIQRAIASFQGSPAKNQDKLRTALAISLGYNNYDELSVLLKAKAEEDKVKPIDFDINEYGHETEVTINGFIIYNSVFQEQLADHYFRDREDEIEELYQMIGECTGFNSDARDNANADMMKSTLDELKSLTDEYVLRSINDGTVVISPTEHPKAFNEACLEILEVQQEKELRNSKSISDDDLCANCSNCQYRPSNESGCKLAPNKGDKWPAIFDDDEYAISCINHIELTEYQSNKI